MQSVGEPTHAENRASAQAEACGSFACVSLLLASAWLVASAAAQVVEGKVPITGFPARTTPAAVAREGQWIPIAVDLRLPGSGLFTGSLRVASEDIDGDIVEFTRQGVSLNAEAGQRRYWCYAVSFLRRTPPENLIVDLLDSDGAPVQRFDVSPFTFISNDDMLVADISDRQIVYLRSLEFPEWQPLEFVPGKAKYPRSICVSFMAAGDVPDRWIGLEAVDALFWDLPTPSQLGENQVQAIVDWVRRGGQLVIGLGANWPLVRDSGLAAIVPVAGDGSTLNARDLKFFPREYGAADASPTSATASIGVSTAPARREAVVMFRDQAQPGGEPVDLIATWCVGSGRVTTTAASLRELCARAGGPRLLERALGLTPRTQKYNEQELELSKNMLALPTSGKSAMFAPIAAAVSFAGQRAFFVLAAFGFVVAYSLFATVGTWSWLVRKKLTMHSWTAFCAAAIVGSALGLSAVWATFGLRQGVYAVSVVDLVGGETEGRGRSWIGYSNASRQIASFAVGDAASYMRALAIPSDSIVKFATPGRYQALPDAGQVNDVPIRATLKQFEGAWTAEVGGTINGQLIADRSSGRLTPGSWIKNDLPASIVGGLVLYLDPRSKAGSFGALDQAEGGPAHWRLSGDVPANMNVLVAAVPPLASASRTPENFTAAQYTALEEAIGEFMAKPGGTRKPIERPDLTTLWDLHYACGGATGTFGNRSYGPSDAMSMFLLASTRSLFLPNRGVREFDSVGTAFTTDGLASLEISHWLIRGQAVLLLWSEQPGPVSLRRDETPIRIGRGMTLYRVRLPLQYQGSPPARDLLDVDEGAGA